MRFIEDITVHRASGLRPAKMTVDAMRGIDDNAELSRVAITVKENLKGAGSIPSISFSPEVAEGLVEYLMLYMSPGQQQRVLDRLARNV